MKSTRKYMLNSIWVPMLGGILMFFGYFIVGSLWRSFVETMAKITQEQNGNQINRKTIMIGKRMKKYFFLIFFFNMNYWKPSQEPMVIGINFNCNSVISSFHIPQCIFFGLKIFFEQLSKNWHPNFLRPLLSLLEKK